MVSSLPKIANCFFAQIFTSGPSGKIIHYYSDSFLHSLQVIDSISATGLFGYLEVDLGVIVGSYWIHFLSLSQGVWHLQISSSH